MENPSIEAMEAAILRLNKFQYPILFFFSSERAASDEIPEFSIVGGDGDYVLSAACDGNVERQMMFPSHGDERIDVWLSDQGCDFVDKLVCHDIDFVLRVLKSYANEGTFPSDVVWY
jgi:hypothetical protein